MDREGARGGICGARLAGVPLRRCVLPPGHGGSHRYVTHFAEPAASPLALRGRQWRPTKGCPQCGQRVRLTARVCEACGWRFTAAAPEPSEAAGTGELSRVVVVALASAIFGLWFVAIPLGIYGRREIGRSGGRLSGRGVATTAIVLGAFDLVATTVLAVALAS